MFIIYIQINIILNSFYKLIDALMNESKQVKNPNPMVLGL